MNFLGKIKKLHMGRLRSFRVAVVVELCLLLFGIIGLFGKNEVYCFNEQAMNVNFGYFSEEAGGVYVDASVGQSGDAVDFNGISLPRGVYRVMLLYDTDTNMNNLCTVTDDSSDYKTLLCNAEHLYGSLEKTDFTMWLLEDKDQMSVHANFGGEGSMTIKGLEIAETNALSRMWIFWVLVGTLLVNVGMVYVQYDRTYEVAIEDKNIGFGLAMIILFASLPLFMQGMIGSGDLVYHLMRIEGIKDGILAGQFPVRIAPEWQQGYGYASSIFYGETLLYVAAGLRLIGFTVVDAYRIFMFLVNVATVLLAYYSFYKIFKEKYIGLLCSMVYTFSINRISKTFICGSIGETFGILFLPLLVYGFYRVFTQDVEEKCYKRAWLPLTVAFTGLIQSHLLTCEQVGAFTILLCILLWKKVSRPRTFLVLAKTVIYTCLLSAWFLVPFLDYMMTGDFVIKHVSGRTIQNRGLYLGHLLFTYYESGTNVFWEENGMSHSQPMGVGIALITVLFVWLALLFFRKTDAMERSIKTLGKITAGFGLLALLMSLSAFPWDKIQSLGSVAATLVSSIQFPNRFLSTASACLTVIMGVVASWISQNYKQKGLGVFFTIVTALVLISSVYLINNMLCTVSSMIVYNEESMGTGYIAGAEYLPYGTDASLLVHRNPLAEENIVVEKYDKDGLSVEVKCRNTSDREGAIELPLLYYKGYHAWDEETGKAIPMYMGTNCVIGLAVQPGYEGAIRVAFVGKWYWRAAEVLSVISFVVLCSGCFWERKKEKAVQKESALKENNRL